MEATLLKEEIREPVVFSSGETTLFGVLHRPLGRERFPLVVFMHGFASSKHGSNRCYVRIAESLAASGIAALRFDFRGSGDSEGAIEASSLEDFKGDALEAIRFAQSVKGVEKLGLFGASLGGALALLAHEELPLAEAVALWAPVASGELWYRDFLAQRPELVAADPSQVFENFRGMSIHPKFVEQFSSMRAFEKVPNIALLHMHGAHDNQVSLAHQEAYRSKGQGEFLLYEEAEHSLGYATVFLEVKERLVDWFKEQLL